MAHCIYKMKNAQKPKIPEIIIDHDFLSLSMGKINEFRINGKYCDWSLCAEDGLKMNVHKMVLQAASSYFACLIDSGMKETKENVALIRNISGRSLQFIVEYIYTGIIEFKDHNVFEIMLNAHYFDLNSLFEYSQESVSTHIDCDNILDLWRHAESLNANILEKNCIKFICNNHDEVSSKREIMESITKTELLKLMNDSENGLLKLKIYCFIAIWLGAKEGRLNECGTEIFRQIKVEHLANEIFGTSLFQQKVLLEETHSFYNYMIKHFQESLLFRRYDRIICSGKLPELVQHKEYLATCKCNKYNCGSSVIYFNNRKKNDPSYKNINKDLLSYGISFNNSETFYASTLLDLNIINSDLVMCGGINTLTKLPTNSCKYYSVYDNLWINLPPMKEKRFMHTALFSKDAGRLFVFGGSNELTCEALEMCTEDWYKIKPIDEKYDTANLCAVQLGRGIYTISKSGQFQIYDVRQDIWMQLPRVAIKGYPRIFTPAYAFDNKIFYINEYVEEYDVRNQKWTTTTYKYTFDYDKPINNRVINLYENLYYFGTTFAYDTIIIDLRSLTQMSFSNSISLSNNSDARGIFSA